MVDDFVATLTDGNTYRFIQPGWKPGRMRAILRHPEYEEPDWHAYEVLTSLETGDEELWRTLSQKEWDVLRGPLFSEVFGRIRGWARDVDVSMAG